MSDESLDEGLVDDWRVRAEVAERALGEAGARLKRAELKVAAVRAGMVDLDGLKLIDLEAVVMGDDGVVADAGAIMTRLRRDKPWLFGGASSSSTAAVPKAEPVRPRHARELSEEEWRAARDALLRR